MKRWCIAGAAVVMLAAQTAGAQDPGPPPCPAGVMAVPTFGVADNPDSESSDAHAYASHPVTLAAGFSLEAQANTFEAVWTLPAGLTRASDDLAVKALPDSTPDQATAVVIADAAGAYPVTLTWTQTDGTAHGRCTGSASTTLNAAAATRPKLKRPHVTPGLPDESTIPLTMPKRGRDLRPLEVHIRWVSRLRFPGRGAKERVVTVPQLPPSSGHDTFNGVDVHAGNVSILVDPTNGGFLESLRFVVRVHVTGSKISAPFGYDLDVRQGGQTVTRLRVAGRCTFFAGFVRCRTKHLRLS